jgi:hypothetical protein
MSLSEMAVQYISPGKCHTTDIARVTWPVGMVVCMSCQCSTRLVGLITDIAFVHAVQPCGRVVIVVALIPLAARLYTYTGRKFVFGDTYKKDCKTTSYDELGFDGFGWSHLHHSPHVSPHRRSILGMSEVKCGDPRSVPIINFLHCSPMAKGKVGNESLTKCHTP